jgi:hypothetical protein
VTYKQDLAKILQYAKDIGVFVVFDDNKKTDRAAEYCPTNNKITVYSKYITSTKSTIATLLHELCHAQAYLRDPKAFKGYGKDTETTYLIEKRDISKMLTLARTIGLQRTPENYIRAWMVFDVWVYWYEHTYGIEVDLKTELAKKRDISNRMGLRYVIR